MDEETNNNKKEQKINEKKNQKNKKMRNDYENLIMFQQNPFVYPLIQLMQRRQVNRSVVDLNLGERSRFYITQFALIKKEGFSGFFKGGLYYQYFWFGHAFVSGSLYGLIKNNDDSTQILQMKHCFSNIFTYGITYPILYISNLFSLDVGKYCDKTGHLLSKKYNSLDDIKKAHYEQYGSYKGFYRGFPLYLLAQVILDPFKFDKENQNHVTSCLFSLIFAYPLLSLRLRQLITPNSDMSIKGTFNFCKDILKKEPILSLYEGSLPLFYIYHITYGLLASVIIYKLITGKQIGNE